MDTVTYTVEGPATLAGVGNGNQMGMDSFIDRTHPLFYGKAVAILRSRPGDEGTVTLTATVDGLPETRLTIRARR
jgi:beta-galactosidase